MMKLKWKNINSSGILTEDMFSNTVTQFLFQQFDSIFYYIQVALRLIDASGENSNKLK